MSSSQGEVILHQPKQTLSQKGICNLYAAVMFLRQWKAVQIRPSFAVSKLHSSLGALCIAYWKEQVSYTGKDGTIADLYNNMAQCCSPRRSATQNSRMISARNELLKYLESKLKEYDIE